MPRITLKDKWDYSIEALRQKEREYAESLFGGKLPACLFHVTMKGDIERHEVVRVGYCHNPMNVTYFEGKTPIRAKVSALQEYVDNLPTFDPSGVIFFWHGPVGNFNVSGATKLSLLQEEQWDFLDEAKAQTRASAVKAKLQHEQELLAAGWVRCQYCGNVRSPEQIHYKTIISRMYRNLRSDPRPYCKDKDCAGYDQMAHEG